MFGLILTLLAIYVEFFYTDCNFYYVSSTKFIFVWYFLVLVNYAFHFMAHGPCCSFVFLSFRNIGHVHKQIWINDLNLM